MPDEETRRSKNGKRTARIAMKKGNIRAVLIVSAAAVLVVIALIAFPVIYNSYFPEG